MSIFLGIRLLTKDAVEFGKRLQSWSVAFIFKWKSVIWKHQYPSTCWQLFLKLHVVTYQRFFTNWCTIG